MEPKFFATSSEFRAWLERNHDRRHELWVGFRKKGSGRRSITAREAVGEALCFGWIDGLARSIDETSWAMRFTPRRPGSNWSTVNIKRVEDLERRGLMHPAGLEAFAARTRTKAGVYSYETRKAARLGAAYESRFRANPSAWKFWQEQAPSYRTNATWWVVSAKREDTRQRRLRQLIADSADGRRIAPLRRPTKG